MVSSQEIRDLGAYLAREYKPERIVLFGSYAYGSPREDSDVDLLMVMPYEGNALGKAVEIVREVRTPFAIDLVIRSPEELQRRLAWGDTFLLGVLGKGRVLYAASGC